MVKYDATQKVIIGFSDETVLNSFINDINECKGYYAEEGEVKDNQYFANITLYGSVEYYPSHNYFDPDEYEYAEIFVPDYDEERDSKYPARRSERDTIVECIVPEELRDKVVSVWAGLIED